MNDSDIEILSEDAINLTDNEWVKIENLIKEFQSDSNILHNVAYLKNKLLKSPYGQCFVTRVIDKDKNCLGFCSMTKKNFLNSDKSISTFEFGDVYLNRKLQGKWVFLRMIRSCFKHFKKSFSEAFVFATANRLSQPWLIRGGFKVFDYQLYFKILPTKLYLAVKSPILKIIFSMINPIYIVLIKSILFLFSRNNNISITKVDDLDEFPEIHQPNHDIELDRSRKYLFWRFINNPHTYDLYKVSYKKNFIGYAVFSEVRYKESKKLFLADVSISGNYIIYSRSIISKILLSYYKINDYVYIATCLSKKSNFWKNLFYCFPIRYNKIPFIIYEDLSPKSLVNVSNKKIHFVLGDGDNI